MGFNRSDSADLLTLKNEVSVDPISMGYAAIVDQTNKLLKLLNDPANNVGAETVNTELTPEILLDTLDTTELGSNQVSAGERDWLQMVFQYGLRGADIEKYRTKIKAIFQSNSTTNANIDALIRTLSRVEVLFDPKTTISRDDWIAARNS